MNSNSAEAEWNTAMNRAWECRADEVRLCRINMMSGTQASQDGYEDAKFRREVAWDNAYSALITARAHSCDTEQMRFAA